MQKMGPAGFKNKSYSSMRYQKHLENILDAFFRYLYYLKRARTEFVYINKNLKIKTLELS